MISMSQQHFATVLKTVVATVAIVVATVSKLSLCFPHIILYLTAGVATVSKPSQVFFFLKINLKYFSFILMAY
jgi:hypothetical protein